MLAGFWYHVAGVYDFEARTLDVYLNGKLDNGILFGAMTSAQHSSRSNVCIGTRGDKKGFEFAGFVLCTTSTPCCRGPGPNSRLPIPLLREQPTPTMSLMRSCAAMAAAEMSESAPSME
jgi:hypothetical protein